MNYELDYPAIFRSHRFKITEVGDRLIIEDTRDDLMGFSVMGSRISVRKVLMPDGNKPYAILVTSSGLCSLTSYPKDIVNGLYPIHNVDEDLLTELNFTPITVIFH